ncbi:MAG: hypothetical protein IPJ26_12275 [Bacteroidetes bacterium]|nr:hypothetical protein [Bacteroidota bacterium]
MTENESPIATMLEKAEEFSLTSIELLRLKAIDKSADVTSSLVSRLAVVLAISLSLLIINMGVALWIGKQLGDAFYGFFAIGGFYALVALLLHQFRHQWIKYPISNSIIKQMLKQKKV